MMSVVLEAGKISPTWSSLLLEKILLAPLPLHIRGGCQLQVCGTSTLFSSLSQPPLPVFAALDI